MFKRNKKRFANMGKVKKSTEEMVNDAVAKQNSWLYRLRARGQNLVKFLRRRNAAVVAAPAKTSASSKAAAQNNNNGPRDAIWSYWFPILCAIAVIVMALWVILVPRCIGTTSATSAAGIPEPVVRTVVPRAKKSASELSAPEFDIVRIERGGHIVAAGRWHPNKSLSVIINKKLVATELTNASGEFTYAPNKEFAPGNYVIRLVGVDADAASESDVFVYIPEGDYSRSLSLLMTKDGSRLLQSPSLADGDLAVSKIDYLENGRIVVTGTALPRLRVTMYLDGEQIGMARVSDHKNFGLGAHVEKLEPGREYELGIRLHDGSENIVATVKHKFEMPAMTPGDETYYTVRHGDALWIIARNFIGRGAMYTLIVEKNKIENPDLIFPKQILQIPIKAEK